MSNTTATALSSHGPGTRTWQNLSQEVEKNTRRAMWAQFRVQAALVLPPLLMLGSCAITAESGGVFSLANAVVLVTMLLYGIQLLGVAHQYQKAKNVALNNESIRILPEPYASDVNTCVEELCAEMQVGRPRIRYHLATRDYSAAPSVVQVNDILDLIIPVGFLKVVKGKPAVARSVLAHELAHFAHHDANGWLLSSSFFRLVKRAAILFVISYCLSAAAGLYMTSRQVDAAREEASSRNIAGWLGGSNYQRWEVDEDMIALTYAFNLGNLALGVVVFLAFLNGIARNRRLAEELADVRAAIVTDPDCMIEALYLTHNETTTVREPFALHPQLDERVRNLRVWFPEFIVPENREQQRAGVLVSPVDSEVNENAATLLLVTASVIGIIVVFVVSASHMEPAPPTNQTDQPSPYSYFDSVVAAQEAKMIAYGQALHPRVFSAERLTSSEGRDSTESELNEAFEILHRYWSGWTTAFESMKAQREATGATAPNVTLDTALAHVELAEAAFASFEQTALDILVLAKQERPSLASTDSTLLLFDSDRAVMVFDSLMNRLSADQALVQDRVFALAPFIDQIGWSEPYIP